MRNYFLSFACFLGCTSSFMSQTDSDDLQLNQGADLNTITTAVPFLQITPDSRSAALGDAGVAISPSANSFFWNTSMLAHTTDDVELALSYRPWLRSLASDIHLSHISGYKRINERNVVGGSLRFFSLGEITFTDQNAGVIMNHNPNEFEILAGYSYQLNDNYSLGINGKFIFSNLTAGIMVEGAQTQPGLAGAADVSFSYFNDDVQISPGGGSVAFGATLNHVGNKISYTELDERDFLPTNLRIGSALEFDLDAGYNTLTWAFDLSKLLVPTPPNISPDGEIRAGLNPNVGVVPGMIQSFYDAPGVLVRDQSGNFVQNPDGSYQVESGSVFREEMSEIMISTGLEYWYNQVFAARMGYFHEAVTKGARQYFTFGIGLKYNAFGMDLSYLTTISRNNPLQNTVSFTLRFFLDKIVSQSSAFE